MDVFELDELCGVIMQHRDLAEDTARLAPDVREAGARAGLWVLGAPREVGGAELPLPDLLSLFERLGHADPTVAWHASNSLAMGWLGARMAEADRAAVFASTDAPFAFSLVVADATARPAEGGYRLEGSWPFMTGAADARWTMVGAEVVDASGVRSAGRPDIRLMAVPMPDLGVSDTWNGASGMRGTGSHAVSAEGVFVPDRLSFSFTSPLVIDRPSFRPGLPYAAWGSAAAVAIGSLRSGIEAAVDLGGQKVSRFDGHAHYQDAHVQQVIADATAGADCLMAGLSAAAAPLWECWLADERPSQAARAHWWSAVFYVMDTTRELASRLFGVSTTAVYASRNPVERALRDIHALNACFESFQAVRRVAGGVLLGHDTRDPRF